MGALWGLLGSALVLGLVGAPHCLTMCGVACAAITGRGPAPAARVHWHDLGGQTRWARVAPPARAWWFQAGRLLGYALLGAVAASLVDALGWLLGHGPAWRPVWVLFHSGLLALGLALVLQGRQPLWMTALVHRIGLDRRWGQRSHLGVWALGLGWVLMPCGLLYSALLLASLSGGPWQGAATMAVFAVGGALALLLGPGVWQHLSGSSRDWGTRLAGVLLCADGVIALWMDVQASLSFIC